MAEVVHDGRVTHSKDELMEQAAARLAEMDEVIQESHNELHRMYEIAAIFHPVVVGYLASNPQPSNDEEQEALNLQIDARYAIENGITVMQARAIREEAEVEVLEGTD